MKRWWNWLALIMILILSVPTLVAADNQEVKSKLVIDKAYKAVRCKAGERVKLQVPLINRESSEITNVVVTPVQDASTTVYPFEIEHTNLYDSIDQMSRNAKDVVTFSLKTRSDVSSGYVKINFVITYQMVDPDPSVGIREMETEKSLYVRTIADEQITEESEPTSEPTEEPQEDDTEEPEGEDVIDDGGEDYYTSGGEEYSSDDAGDGESKNSTPRVIIEGFRTDPESVDAGSQFTTYLRIKNTSKKTSVENIMVTLQTPQTGENETATEAFLPTSGANTLYIESIPANSTKEISIEMSARSDLVQKPYPIEVALKYEDSEANPYEETLSISVPIRQQARFELGRIEASPESIAVGDETSVTFSIYNLGKIKLYNVSARVEGSSIEAGEAFVGNLEAGSTGNVDMMVRGINETEDDGNVKVIVTYEDQDGKQSTYETTCVILVTAAEAFDSEEDFMDDGELDLDAESDSGSMIPGIVGGILAVAAAVTGIVLWTRRRRKKEEEWANDILGSDKDELR